MAGNVPINTGSYVKALVPGVNAWWEAKHNEHATEWTKLFERYKSSRAYEEDVQRTGLGYLQVKGEGEPITYDGHVQGPVTRYVHTVYALGFIITREMFEDNQYTEISFRGTEDLAFSTRQTNEVLAANVYNRAFNSSYVGGDGVEMCSTAHPNVGGGTWSNEANPASALSEASIEQMCIDIGKWQNDEGLQIAVIPKTLHIPIDLMFEAKRILGTPYRVGTADNDINALHSMGKFGEPEVNHYFTDTNAWFVRTDAPHGLKCFDRRMEEFGTDDNDFDTENAKFKVTFRRSFGWTNPRGIWGNEGA